MYAKDIAYTYYTSIIWIFYIRVLQKSIRKVKNILNVLLNRRQYLVSCLLTYCTLHSITISELRILKSKLFFYNIFKLKTGGRYLSTNVISPQGPHR